LQDATYLPTKEHQAIRKSYWVTENMMWWATDGTPDMNTNHDHIYHFTSNVNSKRKLLLLRPNFRNMFSLNGGCEAIKWIQENKILFYTNKIILKA
jgi:hypothetical protein